MTVLTPLEFAQLYFNLKTYLFTPEPDVMPDYPLTPGWKTLRVAKYRLTTSPWAHTFWSEISKRLPGTIDVYVKTVEGKEESVSLSQHDAMLHFKAPFGGKGTPEEAQIAIQLVYRYHKTHMPPEKFVTLEGFIGLDCNGFVGTYIQRVAHNQNWHVAKKKDWNYGGAGMLINDIFNGILSHSGREIHDLDEIRSEDTYVLVLADAGDGTIKDPDKKGHYGHVMITQPNSRTQTGPDHGGGVHLQVVQANGPVGTGELNANYYTLHSPSKKSQGTVFSLSRGNWSPKKGDGGTPVRIARLDMSQAKG